MAAPSIRTSRPATGGRRGGMRGFSPESNESSPPFDATPVLSQLAPEANEASAKVPQKPVKKMTDDWDDGDLDIDIDSLLTDTERGKSKVTLMPAQDIVKEKKTSNRHEPLDDSIDNFPIAGIKPVVYRPNSAPAAQDRDADSKDLGNSGNPEENVLPSKITKISDEEIDLGFVPSFLESGREPRSRRYDFYLS